MASPHEASFTSLSYYSWSVPTLSIGTLFTGLDGPASSMDTDGAVNGDSQYLIEAAVTAAVDDAIATAAGFSETDGDSSDPQEPEQEGELTNGSSEYFNAADNTAENAENSDEDPSYNDEDSDNDEDSSSNDSSGDEESFCGDEDSSSSFYEQDPDDDSDDYLEDPDYDDESSDDD